MPDTPFGPLGSLARDGDANVITFQRAFAAPPSRVWKALTTADGIMSWLGTEASVDARLGGEVSIRFDDQQLVTGTITTWDPTSRFAHGWLINGEHDSHLEYELSENDGSTVLTLTHTGLPDEMCGGYTPGWHAFLARLDARLSGTSLPDWETVFGAVVEAYA